MSELSDADDMRFEEICTERDELRNKLIAVQAELAAVSTALDASEAREHELRERNAYLATRNAELTELLNED